MIKKWIFFVKAQFQVVYNIVYDRNEIKAVTCNCGGVYLKAVVLAAGICTAFLRNFF